MKSDAHASFDALCVGRIASGFDPLAQLDRAAVNVTRGVLTLDLDRVKDGLKAGANAVVDGVKDGFNVIKDAAMTVHKLGHEAFKDLMQSKVFNAVLTVARFIPIPVVQIVVKVVDVARAAYSVYQGIKHGSIGAALGGLATLAAPAAKVAGFFGAAQSTVSTITQVGGYLNQASQACKAVAAKDLSTPARMLFGSAVKQGAVAFSVAKRGDLFAKRTYLCKGVREIARSA